MQGPVFLTGMMGSGKTTVGRRLAEALRADFIDLDVRIERLYGASVAALFEAGEPEFRRRERRALSSLLAEPAFSCRACVVATGGGIVLDEANRADMRRHGRVVYLDVGAPELADRLSSAEARSARPLLTEGEELRARLAALLEARRPAYHTADAVIDGGGPPAEVVRRLRAVLAPAPEEKEKPS